MACLLFSNIYLGFIAEEFFFQNRIKQIYYARNLKYHLANIIYHLDSVSFAIIIFVSIHKIFHFML